MAEETALIIVCRPAEKVVDRHRLRLDRAARFGVPAHVTVTYPFKAYADVTEEDHRTLRRLLAGFAPFTLEGIGTEWFGESVLYVALEDPRPVVELTEAVSRQFPDFPPYGGVFDEVVPHLTVGQDRTREALLAAEYEVSERLPFTVNVDQVELWAGPALAGPILPEWRRIGSFILGGGRPEGS